LLSAGRTKGLDTSCLKNVKRNGFSSDPAPASLRSFEKASTLMHHCGFAKFDYQATK
jgi:hypothetical protein